MRDIITKNLETLENALIRLYHCWVDDVNTHGYRFNYYAQDSYRYLYEKILNSSKIIFNEKIQIKEVTEERRECWQKIDIIIKKILNLYEENYEFFSSLDRKTLALDKFKECTPEIINYSAEKIEEKYDILIEAFNTKNFKSTKIYEVYAFLNEDFHFEIYLYLKFLTTEIKDEFKKNKTYREFYSKDYKEIVDMGLVDALYKEGLLNVFQPLSKYQYYKELNLISSLKSLSIKEGNIEKTYYLINKIYDTINDDNTKKYWLKRLLNILKIKHNNYKSKNKAVIWRDANTEQKEYSKMIDVFFKKQELNDIKRDLNTN